MEELMKELVRPIITLVIETKNEIFKRIIYVNVRYLDKNEINDAIYSADEVKNDPNLCLELYQPLFQHRKHKNQRYTKISSYDLWTLYNNDKKQSWEGDKTIWESDIVKYYVKQSFEYIDLSSINIKQLVEKMRADEFLEFTYDYQN